MNEETTSPTIEAEIAQLRAMAAAEPAPLAPTLDQNSAPPDVLASFRQYIDPFVASIGSRLREPLRPDEVEKLSDAMARVAAKIMPNGISGPTGPWGNLAFVTAMIALPRVLPAIMARFAAREGQAAETPAPAPDQAADAEGEA